MTAIVAILALLVAAPAVEAAVEPKRAHVNVINFNRWGEVSSREEVALTKLELERFDPDRVIILAYGWGNAGTGSTATYHEWIRESLKHIPENIRPQRVAAIGIGWDSAQTGVSKLLNNVIPLPGLANGIAFLPDKLLFPISFWSKGAQADRIGFGGVRTALNEVFSIWEGREDHPEVVLVGHSFGTRIVSGLMKNELGPISVGGEPFIAAEHVLGAVLLQPALPIQSLDQAATYPQVVTMSSYDHANGALFPLANVFLNGWGFTLFESLVRRWVAEPVQAQVDRSVGVVTDPFELSDPTLGTGRGVIRRGVDVGRRTATELAVMPLSLVFSMVTLPINYVYAQGRGLVTRPLDHVMDTLAQVPGVQIGVAGLGRALGRNVRWGQRSKGMFTLGPFHEAAGRMVAPAFLSEVTPRVYSIAEFRALPEVPDGPSVVDLSPVIRRGLFGLDLSNPLVGSTLGWIDLIGAHSDYVNEEVPFMISRFFHRLHVEEASAQPESD